MALRLQDQRSLEKSHGSDLDLEDFAAELTEAAYPVVLRHKAGKDWLDLELDLWKVLAQTVKVWEQRAPRSLSK